MDHLKTNEFYAWAVRDGDIDADQDGIAVAEDNCTLVANPDQFDADGDGYGNICDADLNNSGLVTSSDYILLRNALNTSNANADLNHSGLVTSTDYIILRNRLNTAPGPSAVCVHGASGGCPWQQGDLVTYNQFQWGTTGTAAASLMSSSFGAIYLSSGGVLEVGIAGTGGQSIRFTGGAAVITYLPSAGPPQTLTSDTSNPTTTSSGILGGEVTALAVNVDFSAGGLLGGSVATDFGDLSICGVTGLSNMSVSSFLTLAENTLGAATTGYTPAEISSLTQELNAAFLDGTPSTFAQANLVNGPCH